MSHADKSAPAVAIIGVGSPFGGDRLGWLAVDWLARCGLRQRFPDLPLAFAQSDRPGALLLEQLRGLGGAVVIDAMQAGLPAGSVRAFTLEQLSGQTGLVSSHAFGSGEALALGTALDALPPRMKVIGIEMEQDPGVVRLLEGSSGQLLLCIEAFLFSMREHRGG